MSANSSSVQNHLRPLMTVYKAGRRVIITDEMLALVLKKLATTA